jgi:hypothetical protein
MCRFNLVWRRVYLSTTAETRDEILRTYFMMSGAGAVWFGFSLRVRSKEHGRRRGGDSCGLINHPHRGVL